MNANHSFSLPQDILATVGQTPLVRLNRLYPEKPLSLYGKLECFNPGGSIKDRTAVHILSKAMEAGKLHRGDTVIESSSGNMAIGLAQACRLMDLQLIVVVDPKINKQTVRILETYGARLNYVHRPALTGGFLAARLRRVKQLLQTTPRSFWPNQYANPHNPEAHRQTMDEIVSALDGKLDYLLVATSTCGTLMGCAAYVKEKKMSTKIIGVDAVGSVIFGAAAGKRLIPGHGAGRPSQFLNRKMIADAVHVSDEDCVVGCRRLLQREALLCGGSSGAVVRAFEKYAPQIPEGSVCALIFCDRGERYLDTIYNDDWVTTHLIQHQATQQRA